MSTKFKCCAKPFVNYFFVKCSVVVHKTCIASVKLGYSVRKIGNDKIICCEENNDNSIIALEERNCILEDTLNEITFETKLKDRHYEKLKNDHEAFLNDASMRENDLNEIIKQNETLINSYKEEIKRLEHSFGYFLLETWYLQVLKHVYSRPKT